MNRKPFTTYSDGRLYGALSGSPKEAEAAFGELYSRHAQRVYLYCLKILGDVAEAEDAFQTVFLKFHAFAREGRTVENVPGFLLRIARNLCIDRQRTRKPTVPLEDLQIAVREHSYEQKELLHLIDTALELLTPEYREALVLKEFEGLSYTEMAEITGETVSALKNRTWRARLRLREILTPYLADSSQTK